MEKMGLNFTANKLATATILALLLLSFEYCAIIGEARIECQGKCEDIADCDGFCQRIGFQSGQCYPPLYQYCCCNSTDNIAS